MTSIIRWFDLVSLSILVSVFFPSLPSLALLTFLSIISLNVHSEPYL